MAKNSLAIRRPDIDEEKFRLFTEEAGKAKTEEITNEELLAADRQATDQELNEFFGFDGGIEDLIALYQEDIEKLAEATKDDVIKVEDLKSEKEDPFHIKKFEAEQKVFQKRRIEELKEQKKDSLSHSKSNDYVKDDKSYGGYSSNRGTTGYGSNRTGYGYNTQSGTSSGGGGYGSNTTKNNNNVKNNNGEPKNAWEDIGYINDKTMNVAAQKIPGYKEKPQQTGWGKPSLKRRIKGFFQTKKARILMKTGMMMTLQLGMAVVGKRYKFDNNGQAVAFLGMMFGVFYLTRELVEDGFDPRGFGIL